MCLFITLIIEPIAHGSPALLSLSSEIYIKETCLRLCEEVNVLPLRTISLSIINPILHNSVLLMCLLSASNIMLIAPAPPALALFASIKVWILRSEFSFRLKKVFTVHCNTSDCVTAIKA